ncbi:conserved hypothetical protein [Histoplasma capsulatum G186AR]|uniref:RRM domain-containing protein n=1 Tax=Ajellomyces capsulatus (strain G186AR / H82 / ATCC MYA-2454 / RMSCC 2432) TaxID=447093 RepID=C0NGM9_AJECG|nr:uncharacterized protein HCBG_02501 [Histoplasma capsulatum G186AR]EEH08964.1 conserved hypothetical protein [Histoplasma capsulatum G186AR]
MASTIPDEVFHVRGKTLTPESPQPLHVSEPTHIPLLQSQMDPSFSDSPMYKQIFMEKTPPLDTESVVGEQVQVTTHTYAMLRHKFENLGSKGVGEQGAVSFSRSLHTGYQPKTDTENESTFSSAYSTSQSPCRVSQTSTADVNEPTVPSHTTSITSETPSPLDRPILSENSPSEPHYSPTLPGNDQMTGSKDADVKSTRKFISPASLGDHNKNIKTKADLEGDASDQKSLNTLSNAKSAKSTTDSPTKYRQRPSIRPGPDNIQYFHPLPNQPESGSSQYGPSNFPKPSGLPSPASGTSSTSNGFPPHIAGFQKFSQSPGNQTKSSVPKAPRSDRLNNEEPKSSRWEGDREEPWAPEIQKKYDKFLHNERVYVTEGLWDRFSPGSRLFVGNLPTERVTKRDLFHLFHKYGDLAQISIKQAYGFVQFLEPTSCHNALEAEQGGFIRGRKIHLEISKPQKSTRNAPAPDSSRQPVKRRSRSPEAARGVSNYRGIRDRFDRTAEPGRPPIREFRDRDEPYRRRDDYHSARTPSPRGHRRGDPRSHDRIPENYERRRNRRRSRSPYSRSGRYRSPSPREKGSANDSDLHIPKRSPREVPDVEIIVLENVDRDFIHHIEKTFRDRGLRTNVLILSPRMSLTAVIRRQIIEGVQAIVKLSRSNQYSGKIPLQVFDRTGGIDNVKFNEYSELELNVAADVVLHATTIHPGSTSKYTTTQMPEISQLQASSKVPPPLKSNNNITNLISSLDSTALQSLLRALQQNPSPQNSAQLTSCTLQAAQQHYTPQGNPTDLASILSSFSRQQNSLVPPTSATQTAQPPAYGLPPQLPGGKSDPNLASLLAQTLGGQRLSQPLIAPPQIAPQMSPHIQSIMDQLKKWKQ